VKEVESLIGPKTADLLVWYDRNARQLPWRIPPSRDFSAHEGIQKPDPYRIWLSEIMLQQTNVTTVIPYFKLFIGQWPTIKDLASAQLDSVLQAWAGLGYYARARNLHKSAAIIVKDHEGKFPCTKKELLELPGVGPYTASAIAAIAFGQSEAVVDVNVERVLARLFAVEERLPAARKKLNQLAKSLTPKTRPGDYAQGVMDLGATICTFQNPKCEICPWILSCRAKKLGNVDRFPRRAPKVKRPLKKGIAFWVVRGDGSILLRRRPESGLLGGMVEVPSTNWDVSRSMDLLQAPLIAEWNELPGNVSHGFTHFQLELKVVAARVNKSARANGMWVLPSGFSDQAFPTLTKKIISHSIKYNYLF
jgi:A/G-specific adenine glycosylase